MAHLDESSEAEVAPFDSLDAAASAFAELRDEEQQKEEEIPDEGEEPEEGAEPEPEDDEQEEEPEEPAIDPPVSWNAEEKERFKQLPPETQKFLSDRESQREKFVQTKAQEAAEARRYAEKATGDLTTSTRQYAEQLETIAQAILPQRPDYALLAQDPAAFAARMAHHDQAHAQYQELMQHAEAARQQAEAQESANTAKLIQEDAQRVLSDLPELQDAMQFQQLIQRVTPTARDLGYSEDRIAAAWPSDVRAMKIATEWKDKAEKWDALQKRKMEPVRAAKKVSTPGAAQPNGSARVRQQQESMSRLRETGSLTDAAKAFRALTER